MLTQYCGMLEYQLFSLYHHGWMTEWEVQLNVHIEEL